MRLASAEIIPYALPFKEPYVTARGSLTERELVLLRLRDEDGVLGLGEAVPLSLRGGVTLKQVVRELEELGSSGVLDRALAESAKEDTFEPGWEKFEGEGSVSAPARCAALMALRDLCERQRAGSDLIVGVPHDPEPVPCNATLVAGEPVAVAEDALRWSGEGFATFKLKLGRGDDVGQVRAVRDALGDDVRIRIDANGSWSLEEARRILGQLEPLGIEFAEQPVATTEEAAALAWQTTIPLAGDESIAEVKDLQQHLTLAAFRLTGIKLSKVGGMPAGRTIANLIASYVSSALDGPVGIAAGARLAQMIASEPGNPYAPRFAHGLATQRLFSSTIAAAECELRDGMLHPPAGPGLGVEIDERALDLHRL